MTGNTGSTRRTASTMGNTGARPAFSGRATQRRPGFHLPSLRLLVSPFAIAALGSVFLLPQAGWAADASGGGPTIANGGGGGAGNGRGGGAGDNSGSGTLINNGAASSNGNGGAGGTSSVGTPGGAGGALGLDANVPTTVLVNVNGGNGGDGTPNGGYSGGGGGGGGAGVQASSSSLSVGAGVTLSGGNGGGGGAGNAGSGGGGGGGAGVVAATNGTTIVNQGTLQGGSGGAGASGLAGGGGGGGDGLQATGGGATLTNSGNITGGTGGAGGTSAGGYYGGSGTGGAGVGLTAGGNTINNSGTITGGNGGNSVLNGAAGTGIITFGSDTINNSGTISGGLSGGGARGNAILFNGTGNTLNLQTGSNIVGAIELASGAATSIAAQAAGLSLSNAVVLGSGAALTFDTSGGQGLTATGVISGSGAVTVSGGTATVIFAADNTYTGTTTIATNASLQVGNGGATGTLGNTGNVVNDGTLGFNRTGTVTVANAISGNGTLLQAGTGTLVLTGSNSYAGTTTISAGTLQVGNGGASGTLGSGGVTNNSALAFNRNDTITIANAISGSGTLTQAGTGTILLTGGNSYSGTTTVSAGTLQVGNGGTTGNISNTASIGAGSVLAFNRSDAVTYGGTISGGGTLAQSGAGNLTLTGNSAGFTGNTNVNNGTLSVNGTLGGTLSVASGATLAGTGTVGTTTIGNGATLSAGSSGSIGTLNVNGNLTLNGGSTYAVDIAGAGAGDRVAVSGNAALGGTVRVNALDAKSSYQTGQTYTILSGGAVTGTFSGATTSSSFLSLNLGYTATTATLTITVTGTFGAAGATPNQQATGRALDTLVPTGSSLALYNQLLALSAGQARSAFDMLSGEMHAGIKTGLFNDSGFVRDALGSRLRAARDDAGPGPGPVASASAPQGLWLSGYGAWNQYEGDSPNAARLKGSTGGLMVGRDIPVAGRWRAGLAGGYGRSDYRLGERASSGTVDSYTLGAYAGTQIRNLGMRFGLANTWHSIDTSRNSSFPGFAQTNQAAYRARGTQAFGEAGYTIRQGATSFEPYVGLAYVELHTDAYNENGTAGLHGSASQQHLSFATLGGRISMPVRLGQSAGSLRAGLGWRHADGDTTPAATHAFDGSGSFTVTGVPIARDSALIEAALDLPLARDMAFNLSYGGQAAAHAWQHSLAANLRVRF